MGYALSNGRLPEVESGNAFPEPIFKGTLIDRLPDFADPKLTIPSVRFAEAKH